MKEIYFENYKKINNLIENTVSLNKKIDLNIAFTKLNEVYLYSYLWSIITKDHFIR